MLNNKKEITMLLNEYTTIKVKKCEGRGGTSEETITLVELVELLRENVSEIYVNEENVVSVGIHEQLWYEFTLGEERYFSISKEGVCRHTLDDFAGFFEDWDELEEYEETDCLLWRISSSDIEFLHIYEMY